MDAAAATREVYWNVTHVWVMYLFLGITVLIGGYGLVRRVRLWRLGQPALRFDRLGQRFGLLVKSGVFQGRTVRDRFAAVFHTGLYSGFIILTIATTVVLIHEDSKYIGLHLDIMKGHFYLIFQSLIVDLFGLWVLVGVGMAVLRRWRQKPKQLVYTEEASTILMAIFGLSMTGFLVEGWRIGATADPWGAWSPVGYVFSLGFGSFMTPTVMKGFHGVFWWLHMFMAMGFLAWAPYTKMAHALTAPLAIFTANLDGYGASLKTLDFEKAETLGVNNLRHFTWRDLLDLDACTECGRCTASCPANTVGKELSPRDVILDLRRLLHESADQLFGGNGGGDPAIIRDSHAVSATALFQCTSCAACMEACPVHIEQLPKIIDARRYLVMEEAEFPEGMQAVVTSLESRQHPYSGTQFNRIDWAEGLDVDVLGEMEDPQSAEVLFWVGCGGALVERNRKTVQATAKLLKNAGVRFAVLGREESCSGDPARRIGNEFLFEMLAKGNVEKLEQYGVKKIVTSCPHCFNTFANEYPHLGGNYEVYHHSEFLAKLMSEGKLRARSKSGRRVTFHDPCYLGRHNSIYDPPRDLVSAAAGAPIEMEKSRSKSFCCGGGGGMAFVDEPPNQRVNQERADQALATGADTVAVGCPFCTTMLEDGLSARKGEREVTVMDVAELLLESVEEAS